MYFNQLYLSVELLTGSTKKSKRNEIYRQLLTGELPLLVGTHALIQESIKFNRKSKTKSLRTNKPRSNTRETSLYSFPYD